MPKIIPDMRIYQTVIDIISAQGYSHATTRLIAETAGISEVTLFRKYGSKSELVKRAILALIEDTGFDTATHYTGDIQADLLRVLKAYQDSVLLHGQFFIVLFAEIRHNPELADSFQQPYGLFQSIGQLLARYQEDGILKHESPLHAAASLLGPLIYLLMINQASSNAPVPAIDLATHIERFLHGRCLQVQ